MENEKATMGGSHQARQGAGRRPPAPSGSCEVTAPLREWGQCWSSQIQKWERHACVCGGVGSQGARGWLERVGGCEHQGPGQL